MVDQVLVLCYCSELAVRGMICDLFEDETGDQTSCEVSYVREKGLGPGNGFNERRLCVEVDDDDDDDVKGKRGMAVRGIVTRSGGRLTNAEMREGWSNN